MGKKKGQEEDLAKMAEESYARWEYLRDHGSSDPLYADGTNMNLVRNHISYYKRQMEEKYGDDAGLYPEVYFWELPPEVSKDFMADSGAIRDKAAEALEAYLSDANFQFLLMNHELLSEKEAKGISVRNVLGYASGLAHALNHGDLVTMRRHMGNSAGYQESFARCAGAMKTIMDHPDWHPQLKQQTLATYISGAGRQR